MTSVVTIMTTVLLNLANTLTIEEILNQLMPETEHFVPGWTAQGIEEMVPSSNHQNAPERSNITVIPTATEEIKPPFSYRGIITVKRVRDARSCDPKFTSRPVQVYELEFVPGNDLLSLSSPLPFSLLNRTIKIHSHCRCRAINSHRSAIILQVLLRDDDEDCDNQFESHLLIRDPCHEDAIFSRLFGESYIARQVLRKHLVHNTFEKITPEVAARARLHSVVFCGEMLRKSHTSHNGSVMILGQAKLIKRLAKAVRTKGSGIQRDLTPKAMRMVDLKKMAGNPNKGPGAQPREDVASNNDHLSWLLKKWLPRFDRRDDESYLLVGSPLLSQSIEVPGGKRDWYPGDSEPSSLCALRELYEECGICISRKVWDLFAKEKSVLIDHAAAQNIFFLRLDNRVIVRRCKNGLILLDTK